MKKLLIFVACVSVILADENVSEEGLYNYWPSKTIIRKLHIRSNIFNRYATTTAETEVNNPENINHQTNYTVILPEKAFISNFNMKINGQEYLAHVEDKDKAKSQYLEAIKNGKAAGHVARDTNAFQVTVNVPPKSEIKFVLTYEELLERRDNKYELVINIFPGQIIQDLHVDVFINETRAIDFVRTPQIRSGKTLKTKYTEGLTSDPEIKTKGGISTVNFTASPERQKIYASEMGLNERRGLAGQFVVQYDVMRDDYVGELLLQDNFFFHFLAPKNANPFSKHIVFVLDTSGSMYQQIKITSKYDRKSTKMEQLKQAMQAILNKLQADDLFTIVEFNDHPYLVDLNRKDTENRITIRDYRSPFGSLKGADFPSPFGTSRVKDAQNTISSFSPRGRTNIIGALETALAAIKFSQGQVNKNIQPIIMFLTDGQPVGGIENPMEINKIITKLNEENQKVPIYSLSFGLKADQNFLRKLSMKNRGFSKHIHAESDAFIQLQNFYKEISVPILKDVEFTYNNNVVHVTRTKFPLLFRGSEITVCGYFNGTGDPANMVTVTGTDAGGNINLQPTETESSTVSLERMCAFLTLSKLLEKNKNFPNPVTTKLASNLAKKYSFVTDITSLIVVGQRFSSDNDTFDDYDIPFKIEDEEERLTGNQEEDLETFLPWIGRELDGNNTLRVNGGSYLLGENYITNANNKCYSENNKRGICKLLKDCPNIWPNLSTYSDFQRYFCTVDVKYAGVCCP